MVMCGWLVVRVTTANCFPMIVFVVVVVFRGSQKERDHESKEATDQTDGRNRFISFLLLLLLLLTTRGKEPTAAPPLFFRNRVVLCSCLFFFFFIARHATKCNGHAHECSITCNHMPTNSSSFQLPTCVFLLCIIIIFQDNDDDDSRLVSSFRPTDRPMVCSWPIPPGHCF